MVFFLWSLWTATKVTKCYTSPAARTGLQMREWDLGAVHTYTSCGWRERGGEGGRQGEVHEGAGGGERKANRCVHLVVVLCLRVPVCVLCCVLCVSRDLKLMSKRQ